MTYSECKLMANTHLVGLSPNDLKVWWTSPNAFLATIRWTRFSLGGAANTWSKRLSATSPLCSVTLCVKVSP